MIMENAKDEEAFSIVLGDLGLGETTRSSSYLKFELLQFGCGQMSLPGSDSYLKSSDGKSISCYSGQIDALFSNSHAKCCDSSCQTTENCQASWIKNTLKTSKSIIGAEDYASNKNNEDFPTYADVPYGTSLRQQKKLYEQQMDSLRRQFAASQIQDKESKLEEQSKDSWQSSILKLTGQEIETKLAVALQEMEELKIELEACHKRLDAKYKAVSILKQQAELADLELKKTERQATEISKCLEKEVNKLQFELEWRESSFMDSQQTWAERFDRVCQENAILMSKLEARNEELRRLNAHKSAVARERDELLALLDVTERLKYEQGKSRVAEEDYGSYTSSELAVLGACKCRVSSPEPCGCAHAAANLRKEIVRLREEIDLNQQRHEESKLTVDAYHRAFEEQLARSRILSLRLSQIATISTRSAKAKAAMKWLIQVLNDDDYPPLNPTEAGVEAEKGNNLSYMSLPELVTVLTEMVHEKTEALAHQKLAAQVLANKLQKFEKCESQVSETVETGTNANLHIHKKKRLKGLGTAEQGEKSTCRGKESAEGAFMLNYDLFNNSKIEKSCLNFGMQNKEDDIMDHKNNFNSPELLECIDDNMRDVDADKRSQTLLSGGLMISSDIKEKENTEDQQVVAVNCKSDNTCLSDENH